MHATCLTIFCSIVWQHCNSDGKHKLWSSAFCYWRVHVTTDSIVERSRNNSWHGNATMPSLRIVVNLHVAANNIKLFRFAMEMQKWIPFALLWSCKIFHTTVNHISRKVLGLDRSSGNHTTYTGGRFRPTCDVADITSKFLIVTRLVVLFQK